MTAPPRRAGRTGTPRAGGVPGRAADSALSQSAWFVTTVTSG